MKLETVSEVIFIGLNILKSHLHAFNEISDDSILYLTPEIIADGEIINENAQFITKNTKNSISKINSFYSLTEILFIVLKRDFLFLSEM